MSFCIVLMTVAAELNTHVKCLASINTYFSLVPSCHRTSCVPIADTPPTPPPVCSPSFMQEYGLRPQLMPLLACLLGNDYISPGSLKAFFRHVPSPYGERRGRPAARRIRGLLAWLRRHTDPEQALEEVRAALWWWLDGGRGQSGPVVVVRWGERSERPCGGG